MDAICWENNATYFKFNIILVLLNISRTRNRYLFNHCNGDFFNHWNRDFFIFNHRILWNTVSATVLACHLQHTACSIEAIYWPSFRFHIPWPKTDEIHIESFPCTIDVRNFLKSVPQAGVFPLLIVEYYHFCSESSLKTRFLPKTHIPCHIPVWRLIFKFRILKSCWSLWSSIKSTFVICLKKLELFTSIKVCQRCALYSSMQ